MSDAIERYYDYQFGLLIDGFCRQNLQKDISVDICNLCRHYMLLPNNDIIMDSEENTSNYNLLPNKIEYMILEKLSQMIDDSRFKISNLIDEQTHEGHTWNIYKQKYEIDNENDKLDKLTKSMTTSVNLIWREKYWSLTDQGIGQKKLYVIVCNIVIDLFTKGIEIRYPLISPLIEMYDKYYFDIYISQTMKKKMQHLKSQELVQWLKNWASDVLKERYTIDIELDDEWNNDNSMKMSSMLQMANIEYKDDINELMNELYDIVDIIKIKHQRIRDGLFFDLKYYGRTQFIHSTKFERIKKQWSQAFNDIIMTLF